MAEKLRELEVRVEMQGHRLSATEERWQSSSERLEKIVPLAQLRGVCREEVLKKLCEEPMAYGSDGWNCVGGRPLRLAFKG